jgi:hypothetical protein
VNESSDGKISASLTQLFQQKRPGWRDYIPDTCLRQSVRYKNQAFGSEPTTQSNNGCEWKTKKTPLKTFEAIYNDALVDKFHNNDGAKKFFICLFWSLAPPFESCSRTIRAKVKGRNVHYGDN